ncbi:MAG: efflux RND transporter permease subunit, partial [Myxococcota bacterium]
MTRLISWFVDNGVAHNFIVILILAGGLLSLPMIDQEIAPAISPNSISVSTEYADAAPDEVERGVAIKIEEALRSVQGIKRVSSVSSEGAGLTILELSSRVPSRRVLEDVQSRVDAMNGLPKDSARPLVRLWEFEEAVLYVSVSGPTSSRVLKALAEQVRDELSVLPDVGRVELLGTRPYEMAIEISKRDLGRYGLSFNDVATAVQRSSLSAPLGELKTDGSDLLLRVDGEAVERADFEQVVLLSKLDGTRLLLGDVAQVRDGFAETDQRVWLRGRPAILLQVMRTKHQRILDVSTAVHRYVDTAPVGRLSGVDVGIWRDDSIELRSRRDLLLKSGWQGLVLVFMVLAIFLRFRLAFWVSVCIPLCLVGTLAVLPVFDVSLNMVTFMALILTLGLVVDDSIVIGESIEREREGGASAIEAAKVGAERVAVPVLIAAFTTMIFFVPILFLENTIGHLARPLPIVVIACLSFSLIESLLILPHHLSAARRREERAQREGPIRAALEFQDFMSENFNRLRDRVFLPVLLAALRWRYLAASAALIIILGTVGASTGGWVPFRFLPHAEGRYVTASLTMPTGTSADETAAVIERIEGAAIELERETASDVKGSAGLVIEKIVTFVGIQPERIRSTEDDPIESNRYRGGHLGEVHLQLSAAESRTISGAEITDRWREKVGEITEVAELTFDSSIFLTADALALRLEGSDRKALRIAAEELKLGIAKLPGAYSIRDSMRPGKREIRIKLRPG